MNKEREEILAVLAELEALNAEREKQPKLNTWPYFKRSRSIRLSRKEGHRALPDEEVETCRKAHGLSE